MMTGNNNSTSFVDFFLHEKLSPKLHDITSRASNLGQFQRGVLTSVVFIIAVYVFYACITQTLFIYALANTVRIFMTLFFVFSLFTWLMLIYGKSWGHGNVSSLFSVAVVSEFMEQFFFYNTQFSQKIAEFQAVDDKEYSRIIENIQCSILTGCLCTFLICLTNLNARVENSFVFVTFTCLARLFCSIYFVNVVPDSLIAYFSYLCAFGGCLFSFHIRKSLGDLLENGLDGRTGQMRRTSSVSEETDSFSNHMDTGDLKRQKSTSSRRKASNSNSTSQSNSVYKRRTSLPTIPIRFDKCLPDSLLFSEIQNQVNNIRTYLVDTKNSNQDNNDLSENICKSLQVIKSLIVQAKRNSESSTPSDINNNTTCDDQTETNQLKKPSPQNATNSLVEPTEISDPIRRLDLFKNSPFIPVIRTHNHNFTKPSSTDDQSFNSQTTKPIKTNPIDALDKLLMKCDPDTSTTNGKAAFKTSDYESSESGLSSSDYNSDTDRLQLKENLNCHQIKMFKIKEEPKASKADYIKSISLLEQIDDWNFPIFQLYEKSKSNILSHMAYKIFEKVGLFKSFNIPVNQFMNYFMALESGYNDLPYHNRIHAADVLHACYYLTTSAVPDFKQLDSDSYTSASTAAKRPRLLLNSNANNLGSSFTPLELLALFSSAAMHDYEHPGRNNQFLISIKSPLAMLYNDRSVLENHHASASWRLLESDPKFDFLCHLEPSEWKRFRTLCVENILATDLSKHFNIIADFNNRSKKSADVTEATENRMGLDWTNENDRMLVGQMIIKISDINAPLKAKSLHMQWTERICEEFYQQGEEEVRLGLPQSKHMSRHNPKMSKLQENFINVLVKGLCNSYQSANLLPGVILKNKQDTDGDAQGGNEGVFHSELSSNMESNYKMWCEITRQEEAMEAEKEIFK